MKVLVACEESQRVCIAFRERGHEAYSCDIQECSGGHPEWHIQDDVLKHIDGWDMIIAFPPCTHLAVSGAGHFEKKRIDGRQRSAIEFFCQFFKADCKHIAIENPINIISGEYVSKWYPDLAALYNLPMKPTQIIQPYMFGDPVRKTTALWLKNLPCLKPSDIIKPDIISYTCKNGKQVTFSKYLVRGFNGEERSKHRSKTFPGIAKAMAEQWG
jgi:hypothetical protein